MKRIVVFGGILTALLVALLAFVVALRERIEQRALPTAVTAVHPSTDITATHTGFLHGRVTTVGGTIYQGRMRWGGDEEAFWDDAFNGVKKENPWAALVPPEQLSEKRPMSIFGMEVATRTIEPDLERPFMARFGDIARIASLGRDLRVTLKSGTVFHLDRMAADDLADGLRVWDGTRGVIDLTEQQIRSVEHLSGTGAGTAPGGRLYGTVRTGQGTFTGFVVWNRQSSLGTDELVGRTDEGEVRTPLGSIRSIERAAENSARVTLHDGRTMALSDTSDVGAHNRGIYVEDSRYGRVLVSWNAFERADFQTSDESGPTYDAFQPGHPLTGSVVTRDGRHISGRLVYDLDESETTETLDAPFRGVLYTIPFGHIASIVPPGNAEEGDRPARVTLHDGETLQLERRGDLGEQHGGMLVFTDGTETPMYVRWRHVARIELVRPELARPEPEEAPPGQD